MFTSKLLPEAEIVFLRPFPLTVYLPLKKIVLDHEERSRLIQLGEAIGPAVQHMITIVLYSTYRCWIRKLQKKEPRKRMGQPRTPKAIRKLVLKIAKETNWGYTRILGELRKLGYMKISRQTVVNILKEAGLDPGPKRGPGSWDDLLKKQAETLWQCDFFSKRILSRIGMPQVCVLVFLNVATRRVWVGPCTKKPTGAWVKQQVDSFLEHAGSEGPRVAHVSRDRDKKYRNNFDLIMDAHDVDVRVLAHRAPNLYA